MQFIILTLFPEFFTTVLNTSILKRAQQKNKITVQLVNIRDFANDKYKTVDDHPYGGGDGMILKVDIVDRALQFAKAQAIEKPTTILLDPRGKTYTQHSAQQFSTLPSIILLCGHYEGIDERIRTLVDNEISIGDYIITGGEAAALILVDSLTRLVPGVLKKEQATINESFTTNLLEYPQYTRPEIYNNHQVPTILLSGDHKKIAHWQKEQSITITKKNRPDLLRE